MDVLDDVEPRYDVVIAGARAAGAALAMLLARRGLRVLAVDRGAYGSDTLSTHALMRAGVFQLARWGVLPRIVDAGTPPVNRTVFHYEDGEVVDVPLKPRDGVPALFAPRRTLLDRVLVDAARSSGAQVLHRVRVAELLRGAGGRVEGVVVKDADGDARAIRSGLVVGADGRSSAIARLVDSRVTREGAHATATIYGYWSGLPVDGYQWYWTEGAASGVIPTNDGQALVFTGMNAHTFAGEPRDTAETYRRLLWRTAPDLAVRLGGARLEGALVGFGGRPGFLRKSWGPGWALVGDAGYFKDPITAHGISDALRDAELLADAIAHGGDGALATYQEERDALSSGLFEITDRVASCRWDLAELRALHHALSGEMKREVAAMAARWSPEPLAKAS